MTRKERLENLTTAQRQLLVEQLRARQVLKQKQGRLQLVAVVSGCTSNQEHHLHEHLGNLLPDYMLPGKWHFMDALPRNNNGKLDRQTIQRQLAAQLNDNVTIETETDPQASDVDPDLSAEMENIEKTLSVIWADVLFMDEVQCDDDYFELGGDSIASMQIVARAGKQGLEFSTQDIMRFPSIRQLARRLVALQSTQSDATEEIAEQETEAVADVMRVLNLGDQ